jgi:isopenicillin N synthase-like dioxygenase
MEAKLPIMDLAIYKTYRQIADDDACQLGRQICDAFQTTGFMYVKNHGIDSSQVLFKSTCVLEVLHIFYLFFF